MFSPKSRAALNSSAEIAAPVGGDHRVGARGLDLGDVGREVAHRGDRHEVVADDLDVRPLACQVLLGGLGHLLAVGVVLVQQVDLLDLGALDEIGGQRLDLHLARRIEAKLPEAAAVVGEARVHGRVVQVHRGLVRLALGQLVQRIDQREGHARTAALGDVADALVGGRLEHRHAFLRRALAVEGHDLELRVVRPAPGIDLDDHFAQLLERAFARLREGPRQHVDEGDLHGLRRQRQGRRADQAGGHRDASGEWFEMQHGGVFQ